MTHYGKIKSYDTCKGAGTITPEKGGEPLPFVKADLQQEAQEPKVDQRYGYETKQVDGGKQQAMNLQQEQGQPEKAGAEKQQT
ncbi:cold-shock protein [Qipengyuania sp. CAU 1752]